MKDQSEQLLESWVGLTSILKNSRITGDMPYNEALVLLKVYRQIQEDGNYKVSIKSIIASTGMLKSLVNRTVDSLVKKGYVKKVRGDDDARKVYLIANKDSMEQFMQTHEKSIALADRVIGIIGKEDAQAVIRAYEKLSLINVNELI